MCGMNEGSNFKQYIFRIADVSNLKINALSNVERLKLSVNKIGNKNLQNLIISKGKR